MEPTGLSVVCSRRGLSITERGDNQKGQEMSLPCPFPKKIIDLLDGEDPRAESDKKSAIRVIKQNAVDSRPEFLASFV